MRSERRCTITTSTTRLALALAAAVALAALAVSPARAADETAKAPDDAAITTAVLAELMDDPGVGAQDIDIATRDGVVTLTGTTVRLIDKRRAERIAAAMKGVRSVVNRIDVQPPKRKDAAVAQDIENALRLDPATDEWEIGVKVRDGRVTLSGAVASWREKRLVAKIARAVRGVRAVDNAITVAEETTRPDDEIRAEIERTMEWSALVDGADVDVVVEDGKVRLSGAVGSLAERQRAYVDAWVAGVEDVDTSGLTVQSWSRAARFRGSKYVERSDEDVRTAVRDALAADPRVDAKPIAVVVDEGSVTLTGTVGDLKAKRAAARDARNTVGVWRLRNYLRVRPDTAVSDADLAERVRLALTLEPYASRREIAVAVENGVVTLAGTVDSSFEKAQADDAVSRVAGVRAVDNDLAVDGADVVMTYDPYVDEDWYLYDFDWYTAPDRMAYNPSDWEIRQAIIDELYWSPFVNSGDVVVTVDDGVARLTGTVATWGERAAATENALEGGARRVLDDLQVTAGPSTYEP